MHIGEKSSLSVALFRYLKQVIDSKRIPLSMGVALFLATFQEEIQHIILFQLALGVEQKLHA